MRVEIRYKRVREVSNVLEVTEDELRMLSNGNMPEWIEDEMERELSVSNSYTDYCVDDLNGIQIVPWS